MTTKRAIKLIKIDVEHYKKLIIKMDESRDRFFKDNNLNDSHSDSVRDMTGKIMQKVYKMLNSLHEDQIKYYEDILAELEPKKK